MDGPRPTAKLIVPGVGRGSRAGPTG